ncbi:MAG: hypothetical protein ACREYE_08970, partial [Gammaproteobacteria bacterium]
MNNSFPHVLYRAFETHEYADAFTNGKFRMGALRACEKSVALGISRSGGARNPHVFQYTLRFLRSGGTRPSFARDGFFTNSQ